MAMKFVVASDSFKGSLSSAEVAAAVAKGVMCVLPSAQVECLAVADGGEGTSETLINALGGERVSCTVANPIGRSTTATYGIVSSPFGLTALIDMASASGLTLLSVEERDVMAASTYGTGQLIVDAYRRGCRHFMVGIGGSATCDGGSGMLSALGFRFLDAFGRDLQQGGGALSELQAIDMSGALAGILQCKFTIMCDVDNPLYGPEGAAFQFAPQKGATSADVEHLDAALRRYAEVVMSSTGKNVAEIPGAGAAGGLGEAFLAFFDCELKPGVEAVLDIVGFDRAIQNASLVITGEGKIDGQTLHGKLPLGVCRRAAAAGVPTVAIAGMVDDAYRLLSGGFAGVFPVLRRVVTLGQAMSSSEAEANVSAVAASIARFYGAVASDC